MQDFVNAAAKNVSGSTHALPTAEEVYTMKEICCLARILGKRMVQKGIIKPSDCEDEEEDMKLKLVRAVSQGKYDSSRGSFAAFAGSVLRNCASARTRNLYRKARRVNHYPSFEVSLDVLGDDCLPAPEEQEKRGWADGLSEEAKTVWENCLHYRSARQCAADLGIPYSTFRDKYLGKLRAELRRCTTEAER